MVWCTCFNTHILIRLKMRMMLLQKRLLNDTGLFVSAKTTRLSHGRDVKEKHFIQIF